MKRLVAPSLIAASMIATSVAAHAASPYQANGAYTTMSPAAGEAPLSSDEYDHNLDGLTPADRNIAIVPDDSVPPTVVNTPVNTITHPPVFVPGKADRIPADAKIGHNNAHAREIPLIETHNATVVGPDVTYVTGGIGQDEKDAIEASKADYNLYVMSASVDGAFVGDAHVDITQKNGNAVTTVLSVVAGPLLYVKLPAGTYTLSASLGDQGKTQTFTIGKKATTENIHLGWKVPATVTK